jgi:hypothetical protein
MSYRLPARTRGSVSGQCQCQLGASYHGILCLCGRECIGKSQILSDQLSALTLALALFPPCDVPLLPLVLTGYLSRAGKERGIFLFKLVQKPLGH